jgi:hypothetical protein
LQHCPFKHIFDRKQREEEQRKEAELKMLQHCPFKHIFDRKQREEEQRKEAELKMLQHWRINNPRVREVGREISFQLIWIEIYEQKIVTGESTIHGSER